VHICCYENIRTWECRVRHDDFHDLGAYTLFELIPCAITHGLTDPKKYALRWIAGRHAGVPEFAPHTQLQSRKAYAQKVVQHSENTNSWSAVPNPQAAVNVRKSNFREQNDLTLHHINQAVNACTCLRRCLFSVKPLYRYLTREEVRAMEGARAPEFRPYWIRYIIAFWAGEKLKWARDNILVACLCSLAPGLIAAGISAALGDNKWRAATYATLLTYAGLFALFLTWRLVSTPFELDRERQRFINGLTKSLARTKFKLAELQASPPTIDIEVLEIHVQAAHSLPASHTPDFPIAGDIFLRVKMTLAGTQPIDILEYELTTVLHGNSLRADFVDDIEGWGLVTEKKPVGIGKTFCYTMSTLTKLVEKVKRAGVPAEGWLHFHIKGVHQNEIGATVYRLSVLTPTGAISTDIKGEKALAGPEFQKLPYAAHAKGSVYH
jgi:hypothetical protein